MKTKTKTKKTKQVIGTGKPKTVEITYMDGVNIADAESLADSLQMMMELEATLKPILASIEATRNQSATFMHSHGVKVVQLDGCYFRLIQRTSRFWDALKVKRIVKGKKVDGKPLWNFITARSLDAQKLDQAIQLGYIDEKTVKAAYLEKVGNPFIQVFKGEIVGDEDL